MRTSAKNFPKLVSLNSMVSFGNEANRNIMAMGMKSLPVEIVVDMMGYFFLCGGIYFIPILVVRKKLIAQIKGGIYYINIHITSFFPTTEKRTL